MDLHYEQLWDKHVKLKLGAPRHKSPRRKKVAEKIINPHEIKSISSCPSVYESCKDITHHGVFGSISSLYYSCTSLASRVFPFAGKSFLYFPIRPRVLKVMVDLGFHQASRVQEQVLPILLSNNYQTCLVQSQSGTGKTLAYVTVMLSKVDIKKPYTQILCIEPTGELVQQTYELVSALATEYPQIKIFPFHNDDAHIKRRKIRDHIIIAESGKNLQEYIDARAFDFFFIDMVIYDEADLIIDKHRRQLLTINRNLKRSCRVFYFSATFTLESNHLIRQLADTYVEVKLKRNEMFLETVFQYYTRCKGEYKYKAIKSIYQQVKDGFVFVFTHSKKKILAISKLLFEDGISNCYIRDDNDIDDRLFVYNTILASGRGIILSTDIWARGIDLNPKVVVNFDLPDVNGTDSGIEMYLHRVGRTGRFGRTGVAITLIQSYPEELFLKRVEIEYNVSIKKMSLSLKDLKEIRDLCR